MRRADRRLRVPAEAAYHRAHAGQQLAQLERLDQVVVGAEIEPGYTVVQRHRAPSAPAPACDCPPVERGATRRSPNAAAGQDRAARRRSRPEPARPAPSRRRGPSRRRNHAQSAPAAGSDRSCCRLRRAECACRRARWVAVDYSPTGRALSNRSAPETPGQHSQESMRRKAVGRKAGAGQKRHSGLRTLSCECSPAEGSPANAVVK